MEDLWKIQSDDSLFDADTSLISKRDVEELSNRVSQKAADEIISQLKVTVSTKAN